VAWRRPKSRHKLGGLKTGCPSSCLLTTHRAGQPRSFRPPLPRTHLENDNRGDSHEDQHRRRYKDECALRLNHDGLLCGSGPVTSPPGTQHFTGPNKTSAGQVTLSHVSTKDQVLSSELHGEALLTAKRPELQPWIRIGFPRPSAHHPGNGNTHAPHAPTQSSWHHRDNLAGGAP
jgi:hypothetical protein